MVYGTSGLTECVFIQKQTVLNNLVKYCKFQLFNRVYGCTVTDYVTYCFCTVTKSLTSMETAGFGAVSSD